MTDQQLDPVYRIAKHVRQLDVLAVRYHHELKVQLALAADPTRRIETLSLNAVVAMARARNNHNAYRSMVEYLLTSFYAWTQPRLRQDRTAWRGKFLHAQKGRRRVRHAILPSEQPSGAWLWNRDGTLPLHPLEAEIRDLRNQFDALREDHSTLSPPTARTSRFGAAEPFVVTYPDPADALTPKEANDAS